MINEKDIINNSICIRREIVAGVYFLIKDNKIIYVGCGVDCHARLECHRKKKNNKSFHKFYIIPVKDRLERYALEKKYIKLFKPIKNKQCL